MLNYNNLNNVEFEYLCKDIMEKILNTKMHKFAKGRDTGIDLTDNVHTHNIVVQVKHYTNSTVAQLMTSLKSEVEKVKKLSPNQYYICCSKELSPQKIDEIYKLFSDYMETPSNIITLNEIENFLRDSKNSNILEKHFKLWIESTDILQNLNNNDIFIDCESLLSNIENEINLFVETSAFSQALKCLANNKTLFITGNPGVGKTITSKMLVLHYASNGYKVKFSTNISNLSDLKKSLAKNPDTKEITLVDDCFGQAYFNMKESQNNELISLINYVNLSENKLLILNSRITILNEAKEQTPELVKCFNGKQCQVHILDMSAMSNIEKAKIFYNHITFNGMENKYFSKIKKDKRYLNIVKHINYTPRIIEFVCDNKKYEKITPSKYYDFIMEQLDNPREIWKNEYERRLEKVDRLLLLTIYSLSDLSTEEELVKFYFERVISVKSDFDFTINQYEASFTRLLDSFIKIVSEKGIKKIAMINPSVNDYLDGRLKSSDWEKQQLIKNAVSIQQKRRLMSDYEFNNFIITEIKNRQIQNYIFNDEEQRNSLIAYYIGKYKILDLAYSSAIYAYLNNPSPLRIYDNLHIKTIDIIKLLFDNELCKIYKIDDLILDYTVLDNILNIFDFDDMVEVIRLIDKFYSGANRSDFLKTVSSQLKNAIDEYCLDINAYDFDLDIHGALINATYYDEHCESFDINQAVTYLEDEIISDVEDEIDNKLSLLSQDIRSFKNYTYALSFSIYGTEDLVQAELDYEYDYDDEFYRNHNNDNMDSDIEIDAMFNR